MSRWLVSNVPPWLLLLLLIVVVVGVSILLQSVVRRRFPQFKGEAHNDVTKFAFGVVGFVFAFFVGFLVSNLWGQHHDAAASARAEGTGGAQLARDLQVFDKGDRDRTRQSLLDYAHAAEEEWPLAAAGRSQPAADATLNRLYDAYGQVTARTDAQKALLSTSFANLDKVSQARTERVLRGHNNQGPPWSLWAVVFLTSALVLGCAIIYGVEDPRMHYVMVATVATLVAAELFLIIQLAYPYIGEIGVTAEPLREVVRVASTPSP
jgi:hypothetical protein